VTSSCCLLVDRLIRGQVSANSTCLAYGANSRPDMLVEGIFNQQTIPYQLTVNLTIVVFSFLIE